MELATILRFASEFALVLITFGVLLTWTIFVGRQSLINMLVGSFLGLLFSLLVPTFTLPSISASIQIVIVFLIGSVVSTMIIRKVMPLEFLDSRFGQLPRKILLAGTGTCYVLGIMFVVLPLDPLISTYAPVEGIFNNQALLPGWILLSLLGIRLQNT